MREGSYYYDDGENQQNGKDCVADPLGTALMRVYIYIWHITAGYLDGQDPRGSEARGAWPGVTDTKQRRARATCLALRTAPGRIRLGPK